MRVMYVAPRYHTNQIPVMKGWMEQGHNVFFVSQYAGKIEDYSHVCPTVLGYSYVFRIFEFIYVHLFGRKNPYAADIKIKYGLPPFFKLMKCIKHIHPDLAILRERSLYSIITYGLCRMYKIPAILYNQTPLWGEAIKTDLPHKLIRKLTPEYRITPVFKLGSRMEGSGEKDPKAYWAPFMMEPQTAPEKKEYFQGDRINLLCIGKYQERKNHRMMLEIMSELCSGYPVHLTIAGELSTPFHEAYYQSLIGYAAEHALTGSVTFRLNLDREEIYEEYRKADLFILSSTDEPAAVSPIEAMAFSLPVISGSDNGTADYILDGITGYVFENNNEKDLKDKIVRIIRDRSNLITMGAAGYRHLCNDFQFDSYRSVIREILSKMGCEILNL